MTHRPPPQLPTVRAHPDCAHYLMYQRNVCMHAKRAHTLTLAASPPHLAASCNVPPMFPAVACVYVHVLFALRLCCGAPAPPRHRSVFLHRAGSCFMVFPATSCAYSNSICFGGECGGWGSLKHKTKRNMNTAREAASFHERVAPPNEREMRRDFTFASERFAVCLARLCAGSAHPSCQNSVKSSLVGPPLHNTAFVERKANSGSKKLPQIVNNGCG